ncbi:MAG: NAD-dependent epimerase/dehydratase family protein [Promethearchaeota archaeon]
MFVLLTGSFGNVGESTLIALLERGHRVRCFDLKNKTNEKTRRSLIKLGDFETIWGDIRNSDAVKSLVEGIDCIIHTVAIIPPASDRNPELTRQVNIDGTRYLIEAAEACDNMPKIIFTSSVATFGHVTPQNPFRKADDPQHVTDLYTETKIECEHLLKNSKLPWTILRFGAVSPIRLGWDIDPIMFEVPLDQPIEWVHTRDVGMACANAVTADTVGKVLLIGGGPQCQMTQREFYTRLLDAMGIGMLPDSAFRKATKESEYFHTAWMDTKESQRLLQFQTRSLEDYIEDIKRQAKWRWRFVRLIRPIVRRQLLSKSPYYHKASNNEPGS